VVDAEEVAYKDLTPKERRRLLARALIRALLSATLLVVVYYWLPLDRDLDWVAGVVLVLGLSAFTVLMVWHVRSITRARAPGLRAIESLFTALPLFLLVFATVYFIMGQAAVTSFSEPLTRTDALYFTVTVFSTVGFGDITPTTGATRVVVMIQMFGGLLVLGAGLRLLLGAAQLGQKRRSAEKQGGGSAEHAPSAAPSPAPGDAAPAEGSATA